MGIDLALERDTKNRFHSKRLRSRGIARCSPNRDLENPS